MPYLKHTSGDATELRNQQVLGDESPLEFDENGYAYVEDPEVARKLLAMHRHIERGGHGPEDAADSETASEDEDGGEPLDEVAGESGTLPFNPENHTNDEVAERVAEIDDEATLVALRNLEAEQKDRDGATEAIDARLDELEE